MPMKTHKIQLVGRFVVMLVIAGLCATVGVGCNTARGFGRDVERTGEHIQSGVR